MNTKKKSGQILILVLLVVVVSLAIGLSVASRNLSNLKISSQTEQTQRAYTVSENGIESILAKLSNPSYVLTIGSGLTAAGPADSSGAVSSTTVTAATTYERQIPLGEVGQVDLQSSNAQNYYVMWGKKNDAKNECIKPASLEITLVYKTQFGNTLLQRRWFLQGVTGVSERTESSSGDSSSPNAFVYTPGAYVGGATCVTGGSRPTTTTGWPTSSVISTSLTDANTCPGVFVNCANIDSHFTTAGQPQAPGYGPPDYPYYRYLLRIRPLWADTTVKVVPSIATNPVGGAATSLGNQEYNVTSTTTIGTGVTRKLEVKKSALPSVPAIFDFALYSETDIVK